MGGISLPCCFLVFFVCVILDGYDINRGLAWWEIVVVMRKVGGVAVSVFVQDNYVACMILLCLTSVALLLHVGVRPFENRLLNIVDGIGLTGECFMSFDICSHDLFFQYL